MENTKKCTKCKIEKEITEFSKHAQNSTGYRSNCKSCASADYKKNKEKRIKQVMARYEQNKDEILKQQKKYREKNRELIEEIATKYRNKNKDKISKKRKERQKERYNSDPDFKLTKMIRTFCFRVTNAVKEDKELRSLEYLGCSLAEFKAHIESQWQEGMTWENHSMHGWHIDHIKPIDWFIKNSDDPWQANHYLNLQPLWAEENLSKGNKF